MTPKRLRGEDGASLLMALAFLVLFGLLIPALLSLGTTNLLVTVGLREQRTISYAADGATEEAVQYLRLHPECALTCPTSSVTWTANSSTAVASFSYIGTLIDFDRTFAITTTVSGVTRVTATVIIRDSQQQGAAAPPVDVKSWTSTR